MNSFLSAATPADDAGTRSPLGILVADDDRGVRGTLSRVLQKRGFTVWAAANGAEALALYARHAEEIDLVLLDVNMPEMSGPELLGAIRGDAPDVRCCFMTGDYCAATRAALLSAGALAVFPKPFHSVAALCHELRGHAVQPVGAPGAAGGGAR